MSHLTWHFTTIESFLTSNTLDKIQQCKNIRSVKCIKSSNRNDSKIFSFKLITTIIGTYPIPHIPVNINLESFFFLFQIESCILYKIVLNLCTLHLLTQQPYRKPFKRPLSHLIWQSRSECTLKKHKILCDSIEIRNHVN